MAIADRIEFDEVAGPCEDEGPDAPGPVPEVDPPVPRGSGGSGGRLCLDTMLRESRNPPRPISKTGALSRHIPRNAPTLPERRKQPTRIQKIPPPCPESSPPAAILVTPITIK